MKKSVAKIGIILISVIVFPTLFFSVYEISNISNTQQVVDSIYSSQLSSIVFALNEYSDDIVTRWANTVDETKHDSLEMDSVVKNLLHNNVALEFVFYADDSVSSCCLDFDIFTDSLSKYRHAINKALKNNSNEIVKLKNYMQQSRYRKIYPLQTSIDTSSVLVFGVPVSDTVITICGMFIDPVLFIKENLGPKMQNMGQDKFIISVFEKSTGLQVYSNDFYNSIDPKLRIKEELWLFNDFEIGIQLNDDPIEKMVNDRTRTNIIMIIVMDIILLLGAWIVYRNVKSQIKLAQIRSEFVSNVSHEIKTPLALINMYSETLEMGRVPTEEKKQEYVKVINKEANRLSRMVNKILNFAKIENGKREYNFVNANINEVVEQVVSTYQHHFKNKGFEYSVNIDNDLPLINIDTEAIIDSINNLIDNAIKYSTNRKHITISTGVKKNNVFIAVKDIGIGIKEKEQKHIFEKFYRVTDGNLALQAKGSGIGLNIVKHIMDAHNGQVDIESEFGSGSTFKLIFPINFKNNSHE